jgi:gluconate 2-dehydrogenase gamma chain
MARDEENRASERVNVADVLRRLSAPDVTKQTRTALTARLIPSFSEPSLNSELLGLLHVVCAHLVPQAQDNLVDLARRVDQAFNGQGDGWRYDILPPDAAMLTMGLHAINTCANTRFGCEFLALDWASQETILSDVQAGRCSGQLEGDIGRRFFEELLAAAAEAWMADPRTQMSIGYEGFADGFGWPNSGIGLAKVSLAEGDR